MMIVFSLLALIAIAMAEDSQSKTCAGGYQDGAQVDRGRYWYLCQDGQLVPKGCFSDDRKRLNLHESFKTGGYVLECVVDSNGYLSFAYKGCVSEKGQEFAQGDTWEDDKYWYKCSIEGDHLRSDVGGCVDGTTRYNIGEVQERGEFIYECRRYNNNTCSMCPVACKNNGKRYEIGESFEEGKFWYTCTKEEGRVVKKCVGCMHESQRLKDGDRYVQKDSVIECALRGDKDPNHRLVGCHDDDNGVTVERRLGCMWTKGSPPNMYMMKCMQKDDNTAYKEMVKCYYSITSSGGYEIETGCYKIIEDKLVACLKTENGPQIETFPAEQLDQAYRKGVKFCPV